jgi:hypothetical protein
MVIINNGKSEEIKKACTVLKYPADIIGFKTFVREDTPSVQVYMFNPLYPVEETG